MFVKNQIIYNMQYNVIIAMLYDYSYSIKLMTNMMNTTGCKLYKEHILNLWTITDKQNWVAVLIVFKCCGVLKTLEINFPQKVVGEEVELKNFK